MLHELCHLIHNLVLPDGLDNALVEQVYKRTVSIGKYKKIIRRDWAGRDIDYDQAYALVNHMELFAEISVAYLSCNYSELDQKEMEMKDCSPPIQSQDIVKAIEKKMNNEKDSENPFMTKEEWTRLCGDIEIINKSKGSRERGSDGFVEMIQRIFHVFSNDRRQRNIPHCNKFYPFTRGQLRVYDPGLFASFTKIWNIVRDWEDEWSEERKCKVFTC